MNTDWMRDAIETTRATIQDRARLYRKLMICVSFILLASIISAIVLLRALPLCGLVLLVPSVGMYFVADNRLTRRWTRHVTELWAQRKLDLEIFAAAIRAYPSLPRESLDGMLEGLPQAFHEPRFEVLSGDDRRAVIDLLDREASRHERRTMLATAALLLALLCLAAGALLRSGWLMVCSCVSLVFWIGWRTQASR